MTNHSLKVLVTGSNGFIGSNLTKLLVEGGHQVWGLGRRNHSKSPCCNYICHDLVYPLEIRESFDTIIHCAALANPWASPRDFKLNNVVTTENIVRFASETGVKHLVYTSSSSVHYEKRDQFNISESSKIPSLDNQINEYSKTKRLGEIIVENFCGQKTILRPRAVFGPNDTILLPRIIKAAKKNRLKRMIRFDGKKAVGDLIYIDSLSHYIRKIVENQISGTFNLTNHEPVVIENFVNSVLSKLGIQPPTQIIPALFVYYFAYLSEFFSKYFLGYREPLITRFGVSVFTQSKVFDNSHTLQVLGPPAVKIEEGVDHLVKWWRNR